MGLPLPALQAFGQDLRVCTSGTAGNARLARNTCDTLGGISLKVANDSEGL